MRIVLMLICLVFSLSIQAAETETDSKTETQTNTVEQPAKPDANNTVKKPVQNNILGMNVRGNKESPMTLTIVPWRSASHQVKDPELSPAWRPQLTLLQPEAYRRDINAFLKIRKTKK